jgi:hypothetical protein
LIAVRSLVAFASGVDRIVLPQRRGNGFGAPGPNDCFAHSARPNMGEWFGEAGITRPPPAARSLCHDCDHAVAVDDVAAVRSGSAPPTSGDGLRLDRALGGDHRALRSSEQGVRRCVDDRRIRGSLCGPV